MSASSPIPSARPHASPPSTPSTRTPSPAWIPPPSMASTPPSSPASPPLSSSQPPGLAVTLLSLLSTTHVAFFAAAAIRALPSFPTRRSSDLSFSSLDATQINALNTTQVQGLSVAELRGLTTTDVGEFADTQRKTTRLTSIHALNSYTVSCLDTTTIDGLNAAQLAGVPTTELLPAAWSCRDSAVAALDHSCCLFRRRRHPRSPLFPYTTLFRSQLLFARRHPDQRAQHHPGSGPLRRRAARSDHHRCRRVRRYPAQDHTPHLHPRPQLVHRLLPGYHHHRWPQRRPARRRPHH